MKFEIKNRFTKVVQFSCDLSAEMESQSESLRMGAATKIAIKASADLAGANLAGANLAGADLYFANLSGTNLSGANIYGLLLVGDRPILTIGPIGSESRQLVAYMTSEGARIKAGCFFGPVSEFESSLAEKHGENNHAKEYRAALEMIKAHEEIWAPVEVVAA